MTPNINVYDVVVAVKTDTSKLKVGDVISFYTNEVNVNGLTITHRIYQIVEQDGGRYFKTKGDYNQYVDKWTVKENDIVGKIVLKLPQLGRIQFFLGSRGGWLIAILIPALAIIAYDIYKIIKLILIRQKILLYQKQEDIKENNNSNLASIPDLYKVENNSDLSSVTDLHETESNFNSSQTLDLYGEKKEEIINIDDESKE
jgi:signal peptidase